MLIFGIGDLITVKKENEYVRNLPYGFDYLAEYDAYKNIGKKKSGHNSFDKYSAWKDHIMNRYNDRKDNEDFYRFINRRYREKKNTKELMLNMMIPLEITVLTVYFKFAVNETEADILLIGMSTFLIIFLTKNIN